jgi:hypothetical protein
MNEQEIKNVVVSHITPRHLFDAVVVLVAALILHAYISTQNNLAKVDQVRQDVAPIHAQAVEDRKAATSAESSNQNDLAKALVEIAKQKQQPITTQVDYDRIAAMIESRVGGHAQVNSTPGLPDAPSATVSAPKLRDFISDCDATAAELTSCKKSVDNTQALLKAEIMDHGADKRELETTKTALKGGSFWKRLKHDKNVLIVGGILGGGAVIALQTTLKH